MTIICGLHFNRTSVISCEKYDEKYHDQLYLSMLINVSNHGNVELLRGWRAVIRYIKTV